MQNQIKNNFLKIIFVNPLRGKRFFFEFLWLLLVSSLFTPLGAASFEDVSVTHPYFYAIDKLQEDGIVEGFFNSETGGRKFRGLLEINRAEAVKMLLLTADIPTLENDPQTFPDVDFSAWYSLYVNTAVQKKIVKGFPNGKFSPEKKVTTAEFLKMLVNSFEVPQEAVRIGEPWYEVYVRAAKNFRIIPDKSLDLENLVTRGQAAEMIFRAQWGRDHEWARKYIYSGSGKASYYSDNFAGNTTANGEIFDPEAFTAAHRTLPMGTRIKVWNERGDFVVVRINDRGPYHEDRVLDLSRKSFETLGDKSAGVISVRFEVYTDPVDDPVAIPESLRSHLETNNNLPEVPDLVVDHFSQPTGVGLTEKTIRHLPNSEAIIKKKAEIDRLRERKKFTKTPLFDKVSSIVPSFFDRATLRRPVPQKMLAGTVLTIAGTAHKTGYRQATFFIQNTKTQKQKHFLGPVSGKNFSIPVYFLEPGEYQLGLIFDGQSQSKVATIEVLPYKPRVRPFASSDIFFLGEDFGVRVIPEDEIIQLNWQSEKNRVTQISFSQSGVSRYVFAENGISEVDIPYEFFKPFFPAETLKIQFLQAESEDGSQLEQRTNWVEGPSKQFELSFGFPDKVSDKIEVSHFQRFVHKKGKVEMKGRLKNSVTELYENAFVITGDGEVHEFPIVQTGHDFSVIMNPSKPGIYILEIISTEGEILFNRGIYVGKEQILPVFPWRQTAITTNTRVAVLDWMNRIRQKQKRTPLKTVVNLNDLAQEYAERMASEDFIGHISPEGETFQQRIRRWGLKGSYGENIGFGSTFPLALEGLENSASHRKNLLELKWKRVGIGIVKNKKGFYTVHIFGE